ncbi:MAG: AAA family ATPase [Patescibacteria group bacterium]|nr:AAA family ATPase [Patescibacteria group bacterium]
MNITGINISNFLGARNVDVSLRKPVALFCGSNYAGKSSIQEAVRQALVGESVRVGLKKDYGQLITEGAESGFAEVSCHGEKYSISLPSGKGSHSQNEFLPYVLDAQRFARLESNARRSFLFGLMGLKVGAENVKRRLSDRGCDMERVEEIIPMLRAGFDAAEKEASGKARDAKASWKTATGGETWGKDKAEGWTPKPLEFDGEKAANLHANTKKKVEDLDVQIQSVSQELGAAKALEKRVKANLEARGSLEEAAGKYARIQDKLIRDEAELKEWEDKVEDARAHAAGRKKGLLHDLAHALARLVAEAQPLGIERENYRFASEVIDRYESEHGAVMFESPNAELAAKLPEYEKARDLLKKAVDNGKRDLNEANRAAEKLKEMDQESENIPDVSAYQAKLDSLNDERRSWNADVEKYSAAAKEAALREATIKRAADLHKSVQAWLLIAEALSPSGIPAELLTEALDPINDRIVKQCEASGWPRAVIHSDMRITSGLRDYALLSESEKWRVDAIIAEAISHISGIKLLVLDRFDVLDLRGRGELIVWMHSLATKQEIDTALIFGTMKAPPSGLPSTVDAFWIDKGILTNLQQAA